MANFTKKAIRDSFIKLLNEKPLHKITVRDIVDDCGVNRNTFYYYYQDIPELVYSIINDDIDRFISEYPAVDSIEEAINSAMEFALTNKNAVMHIYNSVNRALYEQYQWKLCSYIAATFVDGALGNDDYSIEDRDIVVEYWKCVCFGLIMSWLESGMKPDALKRMNRIVELKSNEIKNMIEKCKNNN